MLNFVRNKKIPWNITLLVLAVGVFCVYWLTSSGTTPYDYFIRLADAFLHGKYYLTESPGWLNELIPIGNTKFAVVYPPAPAILAIPFVFIFGTHFQQQLLSQIMGTLAAFTWGLIAYKLSGKKVVSLWLFLLSAFGNIVWFLSADGSVWYSGQVSAYLFLTLTLHESIGRKRVPLLVLFFGLAILSRLQVALALPLILYLNWSVFSNFKKLFSFLLGLSFFGILYGTYNYLRFGSFTQTGYSLIPGVLKEPWYDKGIFNYSYILANLRVMFISLPIVKNSFPYITPSWGGLSILITTPAFIYAVICKSKVEIFSWLSIILIAFVIFMHGGTGFTQFGYRYAVDFYPLLLFLIVKNVTQTGLKWHHWLLLLISLIVNLWGVTWIKLGWVSF